MTEVGQQLITAMEEAVALAKGEQPAPRIHIQGHAYVPEARAAELEQLNKQLGDALILAKKQRDKFALALWAIIREAKDMDHALAVAEIAKKALSEN